MNTLRRLSVVAIVTIGLLCMTPVAEANLIRGLQEVIGGVLQVPLSTLTGTFSGPPVLGTILGALSGVVHGVGMVAMGAFDIAASAVPIAKTIAPFLIPVFL